jgi:predicted nucleotidyltransferase
MVQQAVRAWAGELVRSHPSILRIGYFGSYAREDWGVASDLDLILIMDHCEQPFWRRSLEIDSTCLPVPVDTLIYSQEEWQAMAARGERFYRMVENEARWIYDNTITKVPNPSRPAPG